MSNGMTSIIIGVSDHCWFGAEARSVMPCFKPTCSFFHQYTITMPHPWHLNQNWQDSMQHRTDLRMNARIVTMLQCTNQVCLSLRCIHIYFTTVQRKLHPLCPLNFLQPWARSQCRTFYYPKINKQSSHVASNPLSQIYSRFFYLHSGNFRGEFHFALLCPRF